MIHTLTALALAAGMCVFTVVAAEAETPGDIPRSAQDKEWVAFTGADTLREFMSGLRIERELANGELSIGEYHADGTGVWRGPRRDRSVGLTHRPHVG